MSGLTDRCDAAASGSEAGLYRWVLPGVGEVVLCAHHSDRHAEVLYAKGWNAVGRLERAGYSLPSAAERGERA